MTEQTAITTNSSLRQTGLFKAALAAMAFIWAGLAQAENPIIQTRFTADPAPMVYKDRVYLYTSHDEDDAHGFKMLDWQCYSSTDMVNWTDHGTVASLATFTWAWQDNGAWAPQVIERDGKFYLYAPIKRVPEGQTKPKHVIAVAVADNPLGPFKDPIGKPLIDSNFDPTALIDEDGQAYLYWGNPNLWYIKLNKDMISTSGKETKDPSMAKVKDRPDPFFYQEGPWAYKRDGHYYMAYATKCCPEGIGYAMSDSPTGPWDFKGYIMKPNKFSSGNHPGIIDYKGKSYVFGFNYALNFALTEKHRERRSVCLAEITYNADGTIPEIPWWQPEGVAQVGTLNPYVRTEAETICWSEGIKSSPGSQGGMIVHPDREGAFIKVKGVDFGKGAKVFLASVASAGEGGCIELHLDKTGGPLAGTCAVANTGGEQKWTTQSCTVKRTAGVHDLFLVFKGAGAPQINVDWWKFE